MFLNQRGVFNYNLNLKQAARKNRKRPTDPENKIWTEILSNQKLDYKFSRQKPLDNFIVDFYCSKLLLVIEIDGDSHYKKDQKEYDVCRTEKLNLMGIKVLRYKNNDVMNNIEGVYQNMIKEIEIREKELTKII
jgi:very-short-patch-repair endonuclease